MITRRNLISATVGASVLAESGAVPRREPFRYSLNTSTISGQKLGIVEEIGIVAKAGYNAIEPWIGEIDAYVRAGGSLDDLGKRIADGGLVVEDVIGFFEWIVDDDDRRTRGLAEARRNLEIASKIGGKRLAAPPAGATGVSVDPHKAAQRYRALLDLGDPFGVVPQAEVWGFSKTLTTLGEAAMVAIESGHPKACILPDVFHLYKGGSQPDGLKLLSRSAVHVIHLNDYPKDPPRESLSDAHRVYPGDGIAPIKEILKNLREMGFDGVLSIELFNRDYWKQDALTVARTALEKTRAIARSV